MDLHYNLNGPGDGQLNNSHKVISERVGLSEELNPEKTSKAMKTFSSLLELTHTGRKGCGVRLYRVQSFREHQGFQNMI